MARKAPRQAAESTSPPAKPARKAAAKLKTAARSSVAKQHPAPTKAATVLAALRQPGGTTIAALTAATGWQPHSVRGFLSGTVRKKLGLKLTSEVSVKGRVYRVSTGRSAS